MISHKIVYDKLKNKVKATQGYLQYLDSILSNFFLAYKKAEEVRKLGLDPDLKVESEPAFDLSERVEKLLNVNLGGRIRELLQNLRSELVALKISEEIALGKFGFFSIEETLNLAIRVGLAIVTEGVTVAPTQGIHSVKIKRNFDGTNYVAVYFAGPIRSAGGTEAAFTLLIADHVRKTLGLDRYKATEEEIGRFIEELRIYERDVGNFQYKVSDEDIKIALNNLPVEVTGIETDPIEVVVHRGLKRIETDRLRGGALRVVNDGVIGRARKLMKLVKELNLSGWEWLENLKGGLPQSGDDIKSHFEEVISGRPVLSLPKREGGFRLRYGRAFNTGLSTVGIHPSLAILLDYAIVGGTQVKLELPGKGATIAFVDSLEPPIVRLKDGSVIKVSTVDKAKEIKDKVEKILYLGDILISYGDFLENNYPLQPVGYTDEWWILELRRRKNLEELASKLGWEKLEGILKGNSKPTFEEAVAISKFLDLPLHPSYLFFWDLLKIEEVLSLRKSIKEGNLTLDYKEILERLGVQHSVVDKKIILDAEEEKILIFTLNTSVESLPEASDVCELLTKLCGVKILPKAGTFVGARVGRPEKASLRKMKPPVHVLFPVGKYGGSTRDILQASENKLIMVELVNSYCPNCSCYSPSSLCKICNSKIQIQLICPKCKKSLEKRSGRSMGFKRNKS